jgi:hypothetical protein
MPTLFLPASDRRLERYSTCPARDWGARPDVAFNRVALSAVHVVADPWLEDGIDWDATLAFRRHIWSLGLGVAEAMDTAQRGMGLDWPAALELIGRSVDTARDVPGAVVFSGVGTDQLAPGATLDAVMAAYEAQVEAVERLGGRIVLMASRALAAVARGKEDYLRVYGRILGGVRAPVILHWLGDMFDPALAGYWGGGDVDAAMEICLAVIAENVAKVDGIKISLLDAQREIDMRRRLPAGVRMYTGDDFNYPELIAGDGLGYSDALLGIFDAIAPAAASALAALAAGDREGYFAMLAPTVALSRHIFRTPTRIYKTGVVFLAYLNGHQSHFRMLGGQEGARSLLHLAEIFRLADAAGLLADPELATARMGDVLRVGGIV